MRRGRIPKHVEINNDVAGVAGSEDYDCLRPLSYPNTDVRDLSCGSMDTYSVDIYSMCYDICRKVDITVSRSSLFAEAGFSPSCL